MHGSPLSKYDNQKIWGKYNYRDYDIIADCYLDVDFNEVFYITDTGRSWNNSNAGVRDKVTKQEDWKLRKLEDKKTEGGGRGAGNGRTPMEERRPLRYDEGRKGKKVRRLDDREGEGRGRPEVGDRRAEVKNKVKTKFDIKIKNTYDLINKIKNDELPDKIMINAHPQRWNDNFVPWFVELVSQNVKNVVKRQINKFRDLRIKEFCDSEDRGRKVE